MTEHSSGGSERLAALTFDLDTLSRDLYRPAIDGTTARRLEDVSFNVVIPRIAEWLAGVDVRATFFTIGDYARRYPSVIRQLAAAGHEIASHTQTHPRNFSVLGRDEVQREVRTAHETLAVIAGVEPRGFRAPGFTTSPALIDALTEFGYDYDSSVVPSWTYTALKHVYKIARLASAGYLYPESFNCARAPQTPYRIASTARFKAAKDGSLLEIPITTASLLQWPMIYGLHSRGRGVVRDWIERAVLRRPFVLMVFHDLEFAAREDLNGLPVGVLTAPHVAEPLGGRLARMEAWIQRTRSTHRFAPLRDVAAGYMPERVSVAL